MKENNTIIFDEVKYIVSKDNQSVTLNPLSFRLLHALAQSPQQVISIKSIMASVWPNKAVGPDTLKQRVFVLRKSLEQSSIKGVSIQAVRGEGYRLLVEQPITAIAHHSMAEEVKNTKLSKVSILTGKFSLKSLAVMSMLIALSIYMTMSQNHDKATSNNRIVLWTNTAQKDMTEYALSTYQMWNDALSQANRNQSLQLILSSKRKEMTLSVQARKERAALISYFEVTNIDSVTTIKLSIVEPTTSIILRTDTFLSSENTSPKHRLQSQLSGIEALLSSEKLYLTKDQREYAKAPIWQTLKALANAP